MAIFFMAPISTTDYFMMQAERFPPVLDFRAKEDAMRIMLLLAVLLGGLVAWEPICRPGPCVPKPVCPYWKITC